MAQDYVRKLPIKRRVPFEQHFPDANPLSLDLLKRLLAFDPAKRITVEEALEHPYLKIWHDPSDEPICPVPFDFGFEVVDDIDQMRRTSKGKNLLIAEMILQEVENFRKVVRTQVQIPGAGGLNSPLQRKDSLAVPADGTFADSDLPPRPQEAQSLNEWTLLEQELASGLDAMQP